jgi:hypothetical protein
MKKLLTLIALLMPISTFALGLINNFEWLEPNNKVEVVVGEPYQLKFNCSNNSLVFTSDYADSWVHISFEGGQHVVNPPTGYSINEKGVITGLVPGSYALHPTGWVQAKSGVDKWLMITVVSERSETESNNTLDTANEIFTKIRFGLYNTSDIDYFKYTNDKLQWGDEVTFKIHYYGSRENPFGYKWSTFCGTSLSGSGSLQSQDQECRALVTSGNTVYLEVYYDQSRSQYFSYGEEFVAEVFINGIPASEFGNNTSDDKINGHEYVDLGLPSGKLWAKTNYGASSEGDYGIYMDWPSRNMVQSVWGSEWSTPSHNDILELYQKCTFTWEYNTNSVYGCKVTGPNGKSIFLPAAGFKILGTPQKVGTDIYYWSDNEYESGFAYALQGSAGNGISVYQTWNTELAAFPIRPIANKKGSSSEGETQGFVDLALPSGLLWATANLGAKRPEESGNYYAWGETTPNKSLYDATTYTDPNVSNISGTEYDAAYTTSGGKCRIPTYSEFLELINYCTWQYTQVNSINGYKVIGANGNSIFLPFVGGKEDNYNVGYSEYGYSGQGFYVSGTAFPYESAYNWYLYMDTDPRFGMYGYIKTRGQTIRPVKNLSSHIDGIINDNSVASSNIYTLDGRLVLKDANLQEAAKNLPKGIYVTNGKKFMVK